MSFVGLRVLPILAGALILLGGHVEAATLTVSSSVGGAPTGINYVNFDNLDLGTAGGSSGGVPVSFSPEAQVVQGALEGKYAPPYLSNSNGILFGDSTNGQDTTKYLTSGSTGASSGAKAVLSFPTAELYMGLLWGSVDPENTLTFYSGGIGGTLVGSVSGLDVAAGANGDQGVLGTLYVNINSTEGFDTVVATSSVYAFEFDNVSFDVANQGTTPLPASILLFGSVLTGGLLFRRRVKRGCPATA